MIAPTVMGAASGALLVIAWATLWHGPQREAEGYSRGQAACEAAARVALDDAARRIRAALEAAEADRQSMAADLDAARAAARRVRGPACRLPDETRQQIEAIR